MKRFFLAALVSGVMLAALIPSVSQAATPNTQACLGRDISLYAQFGAGFGQFVSGAAQSSNGIGDVVQAHLAGDVHEGPGGLPVSYAD
jgi:hypothetical protein